MGLSRVKVAVHYYSSVWISIHRKKVTESDPVPYEQLSMETRNKKMN